MDISSLLIPGTLCFTELRWEANRLIAYAETGSASASCPLCHELSNRIHSRYHRVLADLPCAGRQVSLRVTVRKFYCPNRGCAGRVFVERLDGVAAAFARRTTRQQGALEMVAFALGGEAGARLAVRLGFPASPDTLLRQIRRAPEGPEIQPTALGVDDWAWKRGRRYGTILVDLERHQVIDLLPDRSSTSFAAWLRRQTSVQVISRDRGGEYREGAQQGAPRAIQVADRFHLLKNLAEAMERVFGRHRGIIARIPSPSSLARAIEAPRPDREAARERARQHATERRQLVHSLAKQGLSKSAISRATGFHRQTIGRYLRTEAVPERPRLGKSSMLAPYHGYLLERCRQGCWNAMGLWREIAALGYPGKYKAVGRLVAYFRRLAQEGLALQAPVKGLTPSEAVGLTLQKPANRDAESRAKIQAMRALAPELGEAVSLFDQFAGMLRRRESGLLTAWQEAAAGSGVAELKGFALKLGQDLRAVTAGLSLPWSQGQTEGQVTKLKLLRRQMYGRGNFDLVRKRLLHVA